MERRMRKMENKQKRFQLLWRGSILYAIFLFAIITSRLIIIAMISLPFSKKSSSKLSDCQVIFQLIFHRRRKMERRMRKRENKQKRFQLLWRGSILYALFYTACLYHNASGITYPFFAGGHENKHQQLVKKY